MRIKILIPILFIFLSACNNGEKEKSVSMKIGDSTDIEFDKTKWMTKEKMDYPYRNEMYEHILYSKTMRELKREEILENLGEADRTDSLFIFYTISQERVGLFPLHTKTLVIKFFPDESVEWIKVHG